MLRSQPHVINYLVYSLGVLHLIDGHTCQLGCFARAEGHTLSTPKEGSFLSCRDIYILFRRVPRLTPTESRLWKWRANAACCGFTFIWWEGVMPRNGGGGAVTSRLAPRNSAISTLAASRSRQTLPNCGRIECFSKAHS